MASNTNYISQNQTSFDPAKVLKALVTPRPIAFITSLGSTGVVNAAPFSYFNIVSTDPCIVSVSIGRREGNRKDTARNIALNQEFVVHICPTHFVEAFNLTSQNYPSDVSEIDIAQLKLLPSSKISTPRVEGTLAQLECKLLQMIEVEKTQVELVLGEVVNIHVDQAVLDSNGYIDKSAFTPIARCIGNRYWHQ